MFNAISFVSVYFEHLLLLLLLVFTFSVYCYYVRKCLLLVCTAITFVSGTL